jgi:hypothetical protein
MDGQFTHVSLFLEMTQGPEVQTKYTYSINMCGRPRSIVRTAASEFRPGQIWGWNKAILIERVLNEFLIERGEFVIEVKISRDLPGFWRDAEGKLAMAQAEFLQPWNLEEIMKRVQDSREFVEDAMLRRRVAPDLTSEYVPPVVTTKFVFAELSERDEVDHFFTEPREIYGSQWRLKIFPRGHMDGEGTHVAVFVEMESGVPGVYGYGLEITAHGESKLRKARSVFTPGVTWGWNRAVLIEHVHRQGLMESEALRIRLDISPQNYRELALATRAQMQALRTEYKAMKGP